MNTLKAVLGLIVVISHPNISWTQDSSFIFTYPSAKEIDVTVQAKVSFNEPQYVYEYELTSLPSSQQDVWTFDVLYEGSVSNLSAPTGWIVLAGRGVPRVSWGGSDTSSFVRPGENFVGFRFESGALPCIQQFLTAGWVPPPVLETEPDSIIGDSIFENSKKGKTVGPRPAPEPFVAVAFLDTLVSYTNQSLALGWIANQLTADKYTNLFSTARSQLVLNDSAGARITLTTVLPNVTVDSAAALLTSEAIALLRFNTEYLLDQLPSPELIIAIDIKPGSDPNNINCKNQNGMIPVAILTTNTFDATTVDPLTVRFGRTGTEASEAHNKGHSEDADGDGDLDMVLHFRFGNTGIQCGDSEAILTGQTNDGKQIRGSDAIQTVGQ